MGGGREELEEVEEGETIIRMYYLRKIIFNKRGKGRKRSEVMSEDRILLGNDVAASLYQDNIHVKT